MQVALAIAAACTTALLAGELAFDAPDPLDLDVRHLATTRLRRAGPILAPLFPLGLPVAYVTGACLTARWLRQRRRGGGPAIVSSAVLGWFAQRLAKRAYPRERPRRPNVRSRTDSYPSGHTTGVTAVALTTAYVLARQDLISTRRAAAIAAGAPAIMGAYRILDDEHWTTDVFGGWLLGGAVALACNAILADSLGVARARASAESTRPTRRHVRPARRSSEE